MRERRRKEGVGLASAPMAHQSETPADRGQKAARRLEAAGRKGRRVVRALAQSTLLAAGIAATHICPPEIDSRFHLFDRTLVDRLQTPITRYHE